VHVHILGGRVFKSLVLSSGMSCHLKDKIILGEGCNY